MWPFAIATRHVFKMAFVRGEGSIPRLDSNCCGAILGPTMNLGVRGLMWSILFAFLFPGVHGAGPLRYSELAKHYSLEAPKGFVEFCAANNNPKPNTCAIRLSAALHQADNTFFEGIEFPSGYGWKPIGAGRELATRAASLAKIIGDKWGQGKLVKDKSEIAGKHGIIFFDTITGSKVSGHISLWNGDKVLDAGEYFDRSARTYFWELE
jgi:hypothetical protein